MDSKELQNYVETALALANDDTKNTLPYQVFGLEGMSGNRFRQFLNHLLRAVGKRTRYLEIGICGGSTSVSALKDNIDNIDKHWLIDNWIWSNYDLSLMNLFLNNFRTHVGKEPNFIQADCFDLDLKETDINNVNVYFYDGGHKKHEQFQALSYYYDTLADNFIFIVDDWIDPNAVEGTNEAIKQLNLKEDYRLEIHKHKFGNQRLEWWEGVGIFVLSKNNK